MRKASKASFLLPDGAAFGFSGVVCFTLPSLPAVSSFVVLRLFFSGVTSALATIFCDPRRNFGFLIADALAAFVSAASGFLRFCPFPAGAPPFFTTAATQALTSASWWLQSGFPCVNESTRLYSYRALPFFSSTPVAASTRRPEAPFKYTRNILRPSSKILRSIACPTKVVSGGASSSSCGGSTNFAASFACRIRSSLRVSTMRTSPSRRGHKRWVFRLPPGCGCALSP
mmetsp:Transcript_19346/g.56215  ORF Transcript_19346/g.56215 Transcript_19346/m.56215 type:complete len:229 (-) Transcript_19346:1196-1882(-)